MDTQTYQERPISVNAAAKKYGIPQRTLADWARRGRLRILVSPERHGQKMLIDEGSVLLARQAYTPHWRGEGGDLPQQMDTHYSPPVIDQVELSTAVLVEQYHHYGETVGFKPLTMVKNRQILGRFTENCPTLPLSAEPILSFIHDLPVGPVRKNTYYRVIRAFYNYLADFNNIPTPLKPRMIPRIPKGPTFRVLTVEEVSELINAADNFQERVMVETLYVTACRTGELCSMHSDNLYPDHIVATGKTGPVELPIPKELYTELRLLGDGYLFKDIYGNPMDRHGVRQRVEKLMRRIGIKGKKVGPHTLRHTALSHLYDETGDLKLVQDAAHHADIRMTMVYTHPDKVKQAEKLLQHDPLKRLAGQRQPAGEEVNNGAS